VVLLTNNKNFKLDKITSAIESIIQNKPYRLPKKSIYLAIRQATYDDVEQGIKLYDNLKKTERSSYDFDNNNALIRIGYKLLEQKKYRSAIKILKLATEEFPNHANSFDSLGEAYYINGNFAAALMNYQTSVKLNPANKIGCEMIAKIQKELN
jgi:tetratricopeptide (TPR) repeat protein